MDLCFASNNANKLAEIRAILSDYRILSLSEIGCTQKLEETQLTLKGNSEQKARFVFDRYNITCLADDTGLEVEALQGDPGVYSARYAGERASSEQNIDLLLRRLTGITNRKACFRTVITLITLSDTHQFEGTLQGHIITEKKGQNGFGYDPVFIPDGYSKTLAEMSAQQKNKISHRYQALCEMAEFFKKKLKTPNSGSSKSSPYQASTHSVPLTIKKWSPDDRPREKLLLKGTQVLSDAELIAILIGSGTAQQSAVQLGKTILSYVDNDINQLAKLTVSDLLKIKGIGEAKAVSIIAALELGRRRRGVQSEKLLKVTSSEDAFQILSRDMMDLLHEEFWVLFLNRAKRVVKKRRISEGGLAATVVDPKVLFRQALDERASGIIIAHNHPSGNRMPSHHDIQLTMKLQQAAQMLDIQLIDHLIIAGQTYYSFVDEGSLKKTDP